jgi:hypothetical protein
VAVTWNKRLAVSVPVTCHKGQADTVTVNYHKGQVDPALVTHHKGQVAIVPVSCHTRQAVTVPATCHKRQGDTVSVTCHERQVAPVPVTFHKRLAATLPFTAIRYCTGIRVNKYINKSNRQTLCLLLLFILLVIRDKQTWCQSLVVRDRRSCRWIKCLLFLKRVKRTCSLSLFMIDN